MLASVTFLKTHVETGYLKTIPMTPAERKEKEEEIANLKLLIAHYVDVSVEIKSMDKNQIQEHIDSILEMIFELNKSLTDEKH